MIGGIEGLEGVEHGGVADRGVLDDFGVAFAVDAVGQGGQGVGVDEDEAGLVEGADEAMAAFKSMAKTCPI